VIKMLRATGFDGNIRHVLHLHILLFLLTCLAPRCSADATVVLSLVHELNTVFNAKEAAGVPHKTEEECVALSVAHLRACIAGTARCGPYMYCHSALSVPACRYREFTYKRE
jgi:hypothetical protein